MNYMGHVSDRLGVKNYGIVDAGHYTEKVDWCWILISVRDNSYPIH